MTRLDQQFLRKEARELSGYWIAVLVLLVVSWAIPLNNATRQVEGNFNVLLYGLAMFGLYVLPHTISILPFTSEFSNATMARLLAQPVPRAHIWNRKMLLVLGSLGVIALVQVAAIFVLHGHSAIRDFTGLCFLLFGVISAMVSGPLMAVLLRTGLTALLASMILPFSILLLGLLIGWIWFTAFGWNPAEEGRTQLRLPIMWWMIGGAWWIFALWYARRAFMRLEV
jgi:hypothetical protein